MRHAALLLVLPVLLMAALAVSAGPARALEERVVGDVVVGEGESVDEVSTAWGDVTVRGRVIGDVHAGVGDVRVEGSVGGDVEAGFGDIRVDGPVGGDVEVDFGDLSLERGARVAGTISLGRGALRQHPDARARGPRATATAHLDEGSPLEAFSDGPWRAVVAAGLVAASVLLAAITPGPLKASAGRLEVSLGGSLVLGLYSVAAAMVLSVPLALTGVGALLLLLLLPAYLALLLFGTLVSAYLLGRKVMRAAGGRASDTLVAAVGAVLVSAISLIPSLGGLLFAVLALLGTGAAVSETLARIRPGGSVQRHEARREV